jgi:hypothetical protein
MRVTMGTIRATAVCSGGRCQRAAWPQASVLALKKEGARDILAVQQCLRLTQDGPVCDWQSCAPSQLSQELSARA